MGRAWLNKGRMVLKDGRAALCDECPCGCGPYAGYYDYAYYVDYSAAASGDGLAPATAFKTLNDVFNSADIYNYRKAGKIVCVFIAGAITWHPQGTYVSSEMTDADGDLILSPAASGQVQYTGSRFLTMYKIVFYCWHLRIVASAGSQWMFRSKFLHCTITGTFSAASIEIPTILFLRDNCEISDSYIEAVGNGGGSSAIDSMAAFMVGGSGNVFRRNRVAFTSYLGGNVQSLLFWYYGASVPNRLDCDTMHITVHAIVTGQVYGRSNSVTIFYGMFYSSFKDITCAPGTIVNPFNDCTICLYSHADSSSVYYNAPQVSLGSGTCPGIS